MKVGGSHAMIGVSEERTTSHIRAALWNHGFVIGSRSLNRDNNNKFIYTEQGIIPATIVALVRRWVSHWDKWLPELSLAQALVSHHDLHTNSPNCINIHTNYACSCFLPLPKTTVYTFHINATMSLIDILLGKKFGTKTIRAFDFLLINTSQQVGFSGTR